MSLQVTLLLIFVGALVVLFAVHYVIDRRRGEFDKWRGRRKRDDSAGSSGGTDASRPGQGETDGWGDSGGGSDGGSGGGGSD